MELILENIRCFSGRHKIPIKPLTILVGDNSSGKTTFLAALSVVCDPIGFPVNPGFNEPPYSLGNFDTIATLNETKGNRQSCFSLGYIRSTDKDIRETLATYEESHGKVSLSELDFNIGDGICRYSIQFDEKKAKYKVEGKATSQSPPFILEGSLKNFSDFIHSRDMEMKWAATINKSWHRFFYTPSANKADPVNTRDPGAMLIFAALVGSKMHNSAVSIAPVRTKPKRTYDEFTDAFNPEGDHIPFTLARILREKDNSKQRKALVESLNRFGKESGLFEKLNVRKLGSGAGDPFQVMVDVGGKATNIIDVGYGVSQALPVAVQSVLAAKERLLLLQQPEVHLHPKAQAALGSFFVDMVVDEEKQFVIETHSDYIVDRIRQEIAAGKIKPDSVQILFFEKKGIKTTIHRLSVDEFGNIDGAPPSYREFFLREEMNLLMGVKR